MIKRFISVLFAVSTLCLLGTGSLRAEEYPVAEHPFLGAQCGGLFQEEDPIYRRPMDEMGLVATFALGYYAAAGEAPLDELANRADVISTMLAACFADPSRQFLDALAVSVPAPMDPPPDPGEPITYSGTCEDFFQRGDRPFKGTGPQFTLLSYFAIGFYTGKDPTLDAVAMEDDRALMPALYEFCIDNPRAPLLRALRSTVPVP